MGREDHEARGHGTNLPDGQLRAIVERIERVEAEIKDLNTDKADIYSEAKSAGFDTKIIKKVVAARRKDPAERTEEDALFDLYMNAVGSAP